MLYIGDLTTVNLSQRKTANYSVMKSVKVAQKYEELLYFRIRETLKKIELQILYLPLRMDGIRSS